MKGKLYITSTPIGNYRDITLRALEILKSVDFIISEELKIARRIISHYGIEKELVSLNEHNESEVSNELLLRISKGENAALISDCGTPLFSDPGHLLVDLCISAGIDIIPVPGANSLLPALIGSGLDIEKFYYYGWLSPKKEIRRSELQRLKGRKELIIILDTPYRLKSLLSAISDVIGHSTFIVLAYELTLPHEKFYRGKVSDILKAAETENLKGEYVLLIDNRNHA